MSIFLTIDVSAGIQIALVSEAMGELEVLAAQFSSDPRRHVEDLTPMVSKVLAEAGIERPDALIAGTGPAAFTGLRAGLVTARTLAHAWGVPIYGVSSLEVLALAGMEAGANIAVPVIDARRKEVYALRARAMGPDDIELLEPAQVLSPGNLAQRLEQDPAVIIKSRPNAGLYVDVLGDALVVDVNPVLYVRLVLSRLARRDAGEQGSAVDLGTEPQYLRRPDVHSGAHAQPVAQGNPYAQGA